ncbi:toxin-antitoxin system YwqK family antitoxin [Clostridium sp. DL1XJH146]
MNGKAKWEIIYYPSGKIKYEGFTKCEESMKELVPSGQGIRYFENGVKHMEGSFGDDWFIETGREYYENGNLKFIGEYNKGPRQYYGPRYFQQGRIYYETGELWYEGTFCIKRCGSIGYPVFRERDSFLKGSEYDKDGNHIKVYGECEEKVRHLQFFASSTSEYIQ